jgi:HAMP domain-containing protein
MSSIIADNCEYGIYTRDVSYLERLLRSLSADENLARIVVFDENFMPLIVKELKPVESVFGISENDALGLIAESFARDQIVLGSESAKAIEFLRPVMNQGVQELDEFATAGDKKKRIGFVHLAVSKDKITANTIEFLYSVAVITALLVAVGTALMLVLGKKIAAPIARISQVPREVAEGNLDHQVAIAGQTEISELAKAINFMLERLKSYRRVEGGSDIRHGNGRHNGSGDGQDLVVWVKDTGIGIEPQDIERLFTPFEQVEGT